MNGKFLYSCTVSYEIINMKIKFKSENNFHKNTGGWMDGWKGGRGKTRFKDCLHESKIILLLSKKT